jgi:capsular polysaccharide biosynthesis protein
MAFEIKLKDYADIVSLRNAAILAFLWAIYFVLRAVYNVFALHPLYKSSGLKMAVIL